MDIATAHCRLYRTRIDVLLIRKPGEGEKRGLSHVVIGE